MVLPALCCGVVFAVAPRVVLVRLEPAASLEREALEAVRAGDATVAFVEARLERVAVTPESLRELLGEARALVWFEAGVGGLLVHVLGDDGRERSRAVPWDGSEETAAVAENAGLVVRSFLKGLLTRPAGPAPPAPTPAPQPTAAPTPARPEPPAPRTDRGALAIGYLGGTLGTGFGWQHGLRVDGRLRVFRLVMVGLEGNAASDTLATWSAGRFSVARQGGAVTVGLWWSWPRVDVAVVTGGGVEHLRRTTLEATDETPTEAQSVVWPTLQAQLEATLRFGAFGLRLSVGARSALRALEFRSGEVLAAAVAPVRLESSLAGVWRF